AFIKYHHQSLSDIHLNSNKVVELQANGSMQYVWVFAITALFILLIACVNFMNLSTARSSLRAREVGVRKVLGSMRSTLIKQFLTESMLMTALAFVLGLALAQLALPYYNELADKQLALPLSQPVFWVISLLSIGAVGLLAGSYPAFFLSGFKPIQSLSGKLFQRRSSFNLRNGLVVFQFLIAILLIIGTIVINQQMHFIQNTKLGFEREQVLILDNAEPLREKAQTLKQQLLNNASIQHVTISGYLPIPSYRSDSPLCKSSQITDGNCVQTQFWDIDEDYLNTFEMELLSGRNFNPEMGGDSAAVILNETAARQFGFGNPIGQKVYRNLELSDPTTELLSYTVIGVVKDFHFESLRENISAVSMWLDPAPGFISMKVETDDLTNLLASVEQEWKAVAPDLPFAYRFMDDSFNQMYRQEQRISSIISLFSGLSIFIACLGLFGLAAFSTERRTKEIGVRKVLGASVVNLVALLSKDFLRLVAISLLIAIPLAWYAMNNWLADFAYRTDIKWWTFALAGAGALLIAFLTVSFQSIKAALMNPVKSLRSD
ncbi:MAG: FtsX-like permease family protein, partial [Bacteroidota bacterium]